MVDLAQLSAQLGSLDGASFGAYKGIKGSYDAEDFTLHIDHVQGDPFAAPSRLRAVVPFANTALGELGDPNPVVDRARADFVLRLFASCCDELQTRRGSGKSGLLDVDRPGQQIIERSACMLTDDGLELRFSVGLPARGRRVLGREAQALLTHDVPLAIRRATLERLDAAALAQHTTAATDAHALRAMLRERALVGFVADGAILPRASGIDARPMAADQAVAFVSPPALRETFVLPSGRTLSGMAIGRGVTLIVGGGYHGKSTLLRALTLGIYEHIGGDGREWTVSDASGVTIRAEDGRPLAGVDISGFINNLPGGLDTHCFDSANASGSTSQAAAVMEAVEAGARLLFIDEDTAATNFMIRDGRMQQLIAKEQEPITPFIDRVRELYERHGVSSVLVVGGSGDYFGVADRVIAMREYAAHDVTAEARRIAQRPSDRSVEVSGVLQAPRARVVARRSVAAGDARRGVKIRVRELDRLQYGEHEIDVSALDQLVARSQLNAIGRALGWLATQHIDGETTVAALLDIAERAQREQGLDVFDPARRGDSAAFRRFELAAALNRLRSLRILKR